MNVVKHINIKTYFAFIVGTLVVLGLSSPAFAEDKESTAHLVFKKTSSTKKTSTYVVKKGDLLSKIIQEQFGPLTQDRERSLYRIIRKLNPSLRRSDKVNAGQVLVLPVEEKQQEGKEAKASSAYETKKGDSLIRIIHRELGIRGAETFKTLKQVKQLNPGIRNVNLIYPGQRLILPGGEKTGLVEGMASSAEESSTLAEEKPRESESAILPTEARLAVIRAVLAKMNASIITGGYYFIPIPDMGQATIDCSMIPVVEFDDGSTVLLDFTNRMNETLKNAIESKWGNIAMVKAVHYENSASLLAKAINSSRSYRMSRQTRPYVTAENPSMEIAVDWIISRKTGGDSSYKQALTFIKSKDMYLPSTVHGYIERSGLMMTDVENEALVSYEKEEKSSSPEMTMLNSSNDQDIVTALLDTLGYKPERDVEVKVFDSSNDGFNLTVRADYLLDMTQGRSSQSAQSDDKSGVEKVDKPVEATAGEWGVALTVKSRTNLRAKRAIGSKLKGKLDGGQRIKVDFLKDDWYAVFSPEEKNRDESRAIGYAYAPKLGVDQETAVKSDVVPREAVAEEKADQKKSEAPASVQGKDWGVILTAKSKTNIREKRAIDANIKGKLAEGQKVKGDFLKDDWYAVFKPDEETRDEAKALGYVYAPRLTSGSIASAKGKSMKGLSYSTAAAKKKSATSIRYNPAGAAKQIIFHTKKLPQQFANILKGKGTVIVYIGQGENKRVLIERILASLNMPASYSDHVFTIPENTGTSRVAISMPAFKITKGKATFYLLDYSLDQDIYALLHDKWGVNVIKF